MTKTITAVTSLAALALAGQAQAKSTWSVAPSAGVAMRSSWG
jgi:hypothetical protein